MIPFEQLAMSFQARHIAVPMAQAISVDSRGEAADAARILSEHKFDQGPVTENDAVVGFVLTRHMTDARSGSQVRDFMTGVGVGNIVSADAPVGKLLEWIIAPGMLFVLDGQELAGFVTVSDFNKQAARAYFYLLVASVETVVADLIRRRFADDQERALASLRGNERRQVQERFEADEERNVEADLVAYMDLSHMLKIAAADPLLQDSLELGPALDWESEAKQLVKLRNGVMHPVRDLVTAKEGLIRVRRLEQRAHLLLTHAQGAIARLADGGAP